MASILYHQGDTHTVRGIKCRVERVEPEHVESMFAQGWKCSPEEVCDPVEKVEEVADEKPAEPPVPPTKNPVRLAAQKAGIDRWETKQIATLQKELEKLDGQN